MRRPLKPFVTEYRGGSRRAAGQGPAPGLDPFKSEPSASGAPSPWTPPAAPMLSEPPEDSYEAALRAADALFSGAKLSAKSEASPASASTQQPSATTDAAPKPAAPSTGRILRVLDEPPSAEMLEMQRLEAEHAPKKRGRKPGSKNKPKVALIDAAPVAAQPPAPIREAPAIPAVATVAATMAQRAIAAAPRRPDAVAPDAARGERYAWVRTRLKPGQQWKRRLPKVAW